MQSLLLPVSWQKILLGEPQQNKLPLPLLHRQQAEKPPKLRLKQQRKRQLKKLLNAVLLNKLLLQQVQSLQPSFHKAVKNNLPRTWRCNAKGLMCPQCVVLSVKALWKVWLALVWARLLAYEKVTQPNVKQLRIKAQAKTTKTCSLLQVTT